MSNNLSFFYVGTYTQSMPHVQATSEGIYLYTLDRTSGAMTQVNVTPDVANPSYLALHPHQPYLYAANEVNEYMGEASGAVSAFAIDPATHALTKLNEVPSLGSAPCHLTVDATGQYVLVANYTGGNISMMPIQTDGSLGTASDHVQHIGSSINPNRQQEPHAHSFNIDPANRFAFAADLGMDKVMIYQLDLDNGKLVAHDPPSVSVQAGSGPRHFAFHPTRQYGYVINEIGCTITAFTYDEAAGTLTEIQMISTLPVGAEGNYSTADIHVHPSGKFLYGSNRGHNSIAIFAIEEGSGKLTALGHESTQGEIPRNFALDPTGEFLLAANQNSSNLASYRINAETGMLTATGHLADAPTPVCIKFV